MKKLVRKFSRKLRRGAARHEVLEPTSLITESATAIPFDMSAEDQEILVAVRPYTLTSPQRVEALIKAVRYVIERNIPGAFVECGVWRGGSVLAMIKQLQALGISDRDIYLYDTFEGMTEPTDRDTSTFEEPALATWERDKQESKQSWGGFFNESVFNEADVISLIQGSGYPKERLHFVKGRVEDTIPATCPNAIGILRLDTDWYESTKHELEHLYPLLQEGGVIIIDDYGHWDGARLAVDEYFAGRPLLLHRIDYTGRSAIKI